MLHYVAVPDPKFTVGVPCSHDAICSESRDIGKAELIKLMKEERRRSSCAGRYQERACNARDMIIMILPADCLTVARCTRTARVRVPGTGRRAVRRLGRDATADDHTLYMTDFELRATAG
jgi:hypothetical protein